MFAFLITLLTVVMVLDCIILVFLVLIQLPKKEAGAGLAFGASATDALFGAGSGTVLTKITKYAAGFFFALTVILSLLWNSYNSRHTAGFEKGLGQPLPTAPIAPRSSAPPAPSTNALTNALLLNTNVAVPSVPAEATNAPAAPPTNAPK
jgi:preprotein translocase subunit SecG